MPDTHADQVLARHKLTVHEYHRMGEAGILRPDQRVELIDGELIDMAPIGSNHAGSINALAQALILAFGPSVVVAVQNPVRLDEFNEPQPDFAVLRPRADFYRSAHPTPPDVLLIIESADSSLRYDRSVKAPLYARFAIPEYWLINLADGVVEVYRDPGPDGYRPSTPYDAADTIRPQAAPQSRLP